MPKGKTVKRNIKPEQYFILCSGGVIKNVKELALIIDYLSDEEFKHHVNNEKNDFSTWIKEVFEENELSKQLASVQDKKESQLVLLKHLVQKEVR